MPIRCICVDDEPLARQGLKLAIEPYSDFEIIGEFASADEALDADLNNINVIFLDIEMPRKNGFSMLRDWQGHLPHIIFVTAYDQYAVEAFEQQALDYVLKPIEQTRFKTVIERIRIQHSQQTKILDSESLIKHVEDLRKKVIKQSKSISVKTDEGYFRVNVLDILFVEAVGNHVCLHLKDQQLIVRQTLKFYIAELSDFNFFQVHKSFFVNAHHVIQAQKLRFGDYELTLSNKSKIRLSRRYKSILHNLIN